MDNIIPVWSSVVLRLNSVFVSNSRIMVFLEFPRLQRKIVSWRSCLGVLSLLFIYLSNSSCRREVIILCEMIDRPIFSPTRWLLSQKGSWFASYCMPPARLWRMDYWARLDLSFRLLSHHSIQIFRRTQIFRSWSQRSPCGTYFLLSGLRWSYHGFFFFSDEWIIPIFIVFIFLRNYVVLQLFVILWRWKFPVQSDHISSRDDNSFQQLLRNLSSHFVR